MTSCPSFTQNLKTRGAFTKLPTNDLKVAVVRFSIPADVLAKIPILFFLHISKKFIEFWKYAIFLPSFKNLCIKIGMHGSEKLHLQRGAKLMN